MGLELTNVTGDIFRQETWERILKFAVVNLLVGVVLLIILVVVLNLNVSDCFKVIFAVLAILVAQGVTLSWYEKWRGCHIEASN